MRFYKREGQHILKDKSLLRRIVRYAEIKKDESVLEVGCGTGNLTQFVLKKAGKVYGIEKDRRFVRILKSRFENEISQDRFVLIEGDALKVEWPQFDKFVSNIPYSISSPLTLKLLKSRFRMAVIMYQKEFAERLVAKPGSRKYGRLSVLASSLCKAEIVENVKPHVFHPRPQVESAVVKIVPEPQIKVRNPDGFERLLREAFSMRRKKFGRIAKKLGMAIPEELEDERPENIPPEVYAELSERL